MKFINNDFVDPEEKKKSIEAKAEIEKILTSTQEKIFGKEDNKKVELTICINCEGDLECIPGSSHLYRCDNCGCVYEPSGTLNGKLLWVCVYDPESDK